MKRSFIGLSCIAVIVSCVAMEPRVYAQSSDSTLGVLVVQPGQDDAEEANERAEPSDPKSGQTSSPAYWLGVECHVADATLRTQLGFKDDQGLIVQRVLPDSPAAKCGLQEHDVLLEFNDIELREVGDLQNEVAKVKENEAMLLIIRQGQRQELKITPVIRPQVTELEIFERGPFLNHLHQFAPYTMRFPMVPGQEPYQMLLVRPGVAGPFNMTELPKESCLTIMRTKDGPAKITFTHKGQTIETTSDQLEGLPEAVRTWVWQSVGGEEPLENRDTAERSPGRIRNLRYGNLNLRLQVVPNSSGVVVEPLDTYRAQPQAREKEPRAEEPHNVDVNRDAALDHLRQAVEQLRIEVEKLRTNGKRNNEDAK